ncbi:MAG: polysaccharide deacetylase family protein [Bacilli bacterium]|nr:polysaccharide deacetylase family protein [Bacilli bacterium]
MKKNIFIILISTLFILMLIYLYDEKEDILNKEYRDYKNNISIDYPYFNNIVIDNYLNDYLEPFIEQGNDLIDLLFIDYDYEELDDRIELILYIYQEKDNVVQKEIRRMEFDVINSVVLENNKVVDVSVEYDIYKGQIIEEDQPMVALTFDDGPNHNTSRILDILEKYNVKGTFFILGTNIEGNEKIIKRMHELGMEIGNHMYSHKLLTKLEDDKITTEIKTVDKLIFDITNNNPTLIRPSYGTINKRIKSLMDRPIIIWNVDTLDWKYHNSKKIANRALKNIDDGDIILMHDIYRATANSLEIIIPKLLEDGYQLVTVSELLYYKEIDLEKGRVYSNAN